MKKKSISVIIILIFVFFGGCTADVKTSGDESYEALTVTVEGLSDGAKTLSVASMRNLEQIKLDASYQRTTGTKESYKMQGPRISDVVALAGGDISSYEGIGVVGSDGYYCLVPKDIIDSTPDLMLALVIDQKAKLDESVAPAMLGIQGQYGPYWVKKIEKIILYEDIPKKDIKSVWVFDNLTDGIEPYYYEYYGSKDKAVEIIQIFSRFDSFDSKAFFTMKSSDGFKKNEVMNMIKPQYYIKIEGEDAPTNIAPYIKLGMNVKNISWFSTNEDAVIFLDQLEKYVDKITIEGASGLSLSEILYELEFESIKNTNFELIDTSSKKTYISGESLDKCILYKNEGKYSVVFDKDLDIENIDNLMRIRITDISSKKEDEDKKNNSSTDNNSQQNNDTENIENKENKDNNDNTESQKNDEEIIKPDDLVIHFGEKSKGYMLDDLKSLKSLYAECIYSTTNNYPVKKSYAAKGVDLSLLLKELEIDKKIETITFTAKDGYSCKLTYEQLFDAYSYPDAKNSDIQNKTSVPAILAYESAKDTDDLQDTEECRLKLFVGQRGINEPNTLAMVENIASVEISFDKAEKWDMAGCDVTDFNIEKGTQVNLMHDYMDSVKIYYTLDGSNPTYNSLVYNPSTSYFQPELTVPLTVNSSVTVKAIAVGYGKYDSDIATFEFTVK